MHWILYFKIILIGFSIIVVVESSLDLKRNISQQQHGIYK